MTPSDLIRQLDTHRFKNSFELPADTLSFQKTDMVLFSDEILRIMQDPSFDMADFCSLLQRYCASLPSGYEQFAIYSYSILLTLSPSEEWASHIYELAQAHCTPFQKLFISSQLLHFHFLHPDFPATADFGDCLFREAYFSYRKLLSAFLTPIPKEERIQNRTLVLCSQLLSLSHAPTRTTLERCYTLQKNLGKEVLLINTMEVLSCFGQIPYFDTAVANINDKLFPGQAISYRDIQIPFRQFPFNYLYPANTLAVINAIREYRPYEIIFVGGCHSMIGTLCAEIIPTISIPVVFSALMPRPHQYISVGRTVTETEYASLEAAGIEKERVIESTFCFQLNATHGQLSRIQLGLPEDRFLMGVIGIRLDADVSADFLGAMEETAVWGAHFVFAGKFDSYEMRCEQFPWLKEHSSYIGYQTDILAVWSCLDLYVNSRRLGGGFSVIEAFSMGVPGVTIDFGDVAAAAGADFCVGSYEEMTDTIHRYMTDSDFYREMAEKALKRTETVLDGRTAMEHILSEAENRKFFF